MKIKNSSILITTVFFTLSSICLLAAKSKEKVTRNGNTEIVEISKDGKAESKIIYTYSGTTKTRGEYWEVIDPKKGGKNKPKPNILAGTAVAKHYENLFSSSMAKDQSGIEIDVEKDGYILRSVKTVKYNEKGLPVHVEYRGYSSYPVLGVFNLKTDWDYTYNSGNRLTEIAEKNMSVDSLLLNMSAENKTKIERDKTERPVKITRTIGTVPPVFETTEYTYKDSGANMDKTVYRKCGLSTTTYKVEPSETITTGYGSGIPWDGMKKYDFSMGKSVSSFLIYDDVNKKSKLDGSKFKKMSFIEKGLFLKNIYGYYENEQKGPKWRMGELPDLPDPFLIYKDNLWYK
ncbi:MAG: hypothetical protein V1874_02040 [Spirochaetota bacterium]